MSGFGDGSYPGSYYAASANPVPERPALQGTIETDICVIGGGFSGLSAALDLAEAGFQVRLIEAAKIGWGASGRNGGQIVNGLNASLDKIEREYGATTQAFVAGLVQEGGKIIRDRIARYQIDCDLREGNLFAAYTDAHMRELEAKKALWARFGMDDHEMISRDQMRDHVASDVYAGGMIDHTGGHMHPLNLALGEAAAFEACGGIIHEQSAVTHVDWDRQDPVVKTAKGEVRCKTLIVCGNAYLGDALPELSRRVLPCSTQVMATEPLKDAEALLPTGLCVEDVRYILDYYRLSADGRLLFGGGTVYGGADPSDIRKKLTRNMIKVFPQLDGVRIDHAWSGNFALSFTRVPQMGRLGSSTYFAHGYSGHGVTGSHLFGRILAQAIQGDLTRFDTFAALKWKPFPGGKTLRVPYSVLGSWWYGLRDRMGV